MPEHNLFREYLDKVCEQIRWKKAHSVVSRELGDHLEDEQAALIETGQTEDEAAGKAVLDMGDAALVGSQLDRAYRPRPAWGVIAVTAALMVIGFFARLYVVGHVVNSGHVADIPRSVFFMCVAIVMLVVGYFLDYTVLAKHPLIIGTVFITIVMLLPYLNRHTMFGVPYNTYYYGVYLVVFIPVIYAGILWWWPYKGYKGLISCYLALIMIAFAWAVFGWLPLAPFHCAICGIMLTSEVLKGKFKIRKSLGLLILYAPVALFFLWFLSLSEYIARRLSVVFYPWLEPEGAGYIGVQIRKILANARWFGQGDYTTEYLPSVVNDFMLTFYIHQFGWISLVVVLLLFASFTAVSVILIKRQKSKLGHMLAVAILASLLLQSALYIFNNVLGYFSFSVLPLLSYSNAALVADSFLIGLMLSVFRNDDVVRDPIIAPKKIPRIRITMERLP